MSSFNRVATANMYDNSIRNIGARQNSLVEQNEKMTAGKRVLRASDDPVAAAQAERAMTRIERIQTEQRALDVQRNAVAQAESTMGDAIGLMQEMRALMVSAGNPSQKPEDRRIIAGQLQSLRDQLLNVSNRKDTNGLPLLGALGSAMEPFLGTSSNGFAGLSGQSSGSLVSIPNMLDGDSAFIFQPKRDGVYNASLGAATTAGRALGSSPITSTDPTKIEIASDGSAYEYKIDVNYITGTAANTMAAQYTITSTPVGAPLTGSNPYTSPDFPADKPATILVNNIPGLQFSLTGSPKPGDTMELSLMPSTGVFNVVDDAIKGIGGASDSNAASQAVGQALANMDRSLERLQSVRSYAGELLNRADRITGDQEVRSIQLEGDRSRAEDLDMVQGISDFQQTQVGYQAALQSYAMVQKLSMFNYIS